MKKKKFDKSKLLTTVVVVILLFFFAGGFMIGLDRVRAMEGTFPPNEMNPALTDAPETAEEALEYLYAMLEKAKADVPKLEYDAYFTADDDAMQTNADAYFDKTLIFAMDHFVDHISAVEESEEVQTVADFGEDISVLLRMPDLTADDIESVSCSYIYYSCPSCGETSDEPLASCEICGSERAYFEKHRDEYNITLVLKTDSLQEEDSILDRNFAPRTPEQIAALTADVLSDAADVAYDAIHYDALKINFKVNRLTDEITFLRYEKDITVETEVGFKGKFAQLGEKSIALSLQEKHDYRFTWPKLTLSAETLVIEPKGTDNLLATLVCADPLAMEITWTSSDDSIALVDAEGYIDATQNTGEVSIKASYEYLGKTYSDTCTVFVRVPVESMKMLDKKASLAVGEQVTLETKVSPSDATVQTVTWYSENESVATVDANGVVTAVAEGTVIVYALSDDGYYRSTCEVIVG